MRRRAARAARGLQPVVPRRDLLRLRSDRPAAGADQDRRARALEQARIDLDGLIEKLEEELFEIRGETEVLNREPHQRQEQLSEERERIARLQGDLSRIQGEFAASKQESEVSDIIEGRCWRRSRS